MKRQTVKNWIFRIRLPEFNSKFRFFLGFCPSLSKDLERNIKKNQNFLLNPENSIFDSLASWYLNSRWDKNWKKILKESKFTTKFSFFDPENSVFDSLTFRNLNSKWDETWKQFKKNQNLLLNSGNLILKTHKYFSLNNFEVLLVELKKRTFDSQKC